MIDEVTVLGLGFLDDKVGHSARVKKATKVDMKQGSRGLGFYVGKSKLTRDPGLEPDRKVPVGTRWRTQESAPSTACPHGSA
jgi:hypothetical protein